MERGDVTRRPKYACRTCQQAVVQAPAPARLIEGGLPTEQLVAQIIVAKYADHCPLYRQAQILARHDIAIVAACFSRPAQWLSLAVLGTMYIWLDELPVSQRITNFGFFIRGRG